MKYSARLVTVLAAVALLVVALIGLSTRAQASAVPTEQSMAPAVVQSIDLPGILDERDGHTLTLVVDQTHDVFTAPVAAGLISTTTDDDTATGIDLTIGALAILAGPIGGYIAWRHTRRSRAPTSNDVENDGIDTLTRTRPRFGQGRHPLRV